MTTDKYQLVSIYLNEADKWDHHPLHLEILQFLSTPGVRAAPCYGDWRALPRERGIVTTSLVDVGSKLPVVVQFVEASVKVEEVMPTLRRMAGKRLITVQEIQVVPASADLIGSGTRDAGTIRGSGYGTWDTGMKRRFAFAIPYGSEA